ncbi:MAG TPA: hypothetical protein VHC97_10820 [Thermoanaerobaculia bacterium]|jgi:hypothetical protein|nr:hypothetical protein [Thermoanaerobaculia bacterium]
MRTGAFVLSILAVLSAQPGSLQATPLHQAFDLQGPGLSIAVAGAGMLGPGGRSRSLTVNVGGPVELALLYWAGRDRPCLEDEPGSGRCVIPAEGIYKDQVMSFGGTLLTGTRIGSEAQPDTNAGPINNLAYFADVTDLVAARGVGRLSFPVADGDPASNLTDLDGAGLLVVYTDPAKHNPARVIVYHGLDFAYGEDRTKGSTEITEPFTFNHGAARATARRGELVLFVGDAESSGPDRVDISRNPSLTNRLDGSAGALWDADRFPVDIPIRASATSVQIFSEPIGLNPDSLLWVMAALWLPTPVFNACPAEFWSAAPLDPWAYAGIRPTVKVQDAFREAAFYATLASATLRAATGFHGGPGLLGAAKDLVRAGTVALVNAGHPRIEFPLTQTQVVTKVDMALRSRDMAAIVKATQELDELNGAAGCPLR